MIGVSVNQADHNVVSEFFELFKTPWEFRQPGRAYDVLLSDHDSSISDGDAKLVVIYSARKLASDSDAVCSAGSVADRILSYKGTSLPIYGDEVTFACKGDLLLMHEGCRRPAIRVEQLGAKLVARVGYDLFREIRTLLTAGQPAENAAIPALELHIAVLRDLIVGSGIPLIEIPPVPDGHRFIACLTHDVDHPSIRRHKFDHTMFGFLYRAVLGSAIKVMRRRMPLRDLGTNWLAAVKLPLVHLGAAEDFWLQFDRFCELEKEARSTLFVIPFKGNPGWNGGATRARRRAAAYAAGDPDIAARLRRLKSAGCEIGLHGIDAWCDSKRASQELQEIQRVTGEKELGVRMHWLYWGDDSAAVLDEAGASYDSTVGYNETVGYRAGTTQAYKPLQAGRLLELPMHVMDTALFYPSHLHLSPVEAGEKVGRIVENAARFGGVVTINWHDRSIAPERLWGDFYRDLVQNLRRHGAWFATAGQGVRWFRKRRSLTFRGVAWDADGLRATIRMGSADDLPELRLRVHKPAVSWPARQFGEIRAEIVDMRLEAGSDILIPVQAEHCLLGGQALIR